MRDLFSLLTAGERCLVFGDGGSRLAKLTRGVSDAAFTPSCVFGW